LPVNIQSDKTNPKSDRRKLLLISTMAVFYENVTAQKQSHRGVLGLCGEGAGACENPAFVVDLCVGHSCGSCHSPRDRRR
jgi:hypothetical protein